MNDPSPFKGFKLIGLSENSTPVVISYEEFVAIRLSDYELMNQVEAARIMEVSRPTYTRIYGIARRKVAEALVMGKTLVFQGEKVSLDSLWYSCRSCGSYFNQLEKEIKNCAMCGIEKVKSLGIPCRNEICQECNVHMMQKGSLRYNNMVNIKK